MQNKYAVYEEALAEELIPAMGCTEPIAIAYCAAVCREQLGAFPEQIEIWVSRNIIKNVKSVVVPNTNKMKGIEVACAAGVVAAHSERQLEVLAYINQEEKAEIKALAESGKINIHVSEEPDIFYIRIFLAAGGNNAEVTTLMLPASRKMALLFWKNRLCLPKKRQRACGESKTFWMRPAICR